MSIILTKSIMTTTKSPIQEQILITLKSILKTLKSERNKPIVIQEAAKYLGLEVSYLYKLTSERKIPHFKPNNKKIYFMKSDLDKYLKRFKVLSGDQLKSKASSY